MTNKLPIIIDGQVIEIETSDNSDWESDSVSNSDLIGSSYTNTLSKSEESNSSSESDQDKLVSDNVTDTYEQKLEPESDYTESDEIVPQLSSVLLSRLDELNSTGELTTQVFVKNKESNKQSKFLSKPTKFVLSTSDNDLNINELKEDWEEYDRKLQEEIDLSTPHIINIDKKRKKKFIKNLYEEIQSLRNFIISEIAPVELAIPNALQEAKQELEGYLDLDISQVTKTLDTAVNDAVKIKILTFVFDKLKLSSKQKRDLITKHLRLSWDDYLKAVKT